MEKKKKPFWSKQTRAVLQLFPQGVSFPFLFPLCSCETGRNISSRALTWMPWDSWWDSHVDLPVTRRSDHMINIEFRLQCDLKHLFSFAVSLSDAAFTSMSVFVQKIPHREFFRALLLIYTACRRTLHNYSSNEIPSQCTTLCFQAFAAASVCLEGGRCVFPRTPSRNCVARS